jgi:Chaperone of endosialidase
MPTITNYGDVVTTGNTTSQGTGSSTFAGSLGCTTLTATGVSVSGSASVAQFLGVGGFTPGGSTFGVTGNVYASNALNTTNVFATTLTVSNSIAIAGNLYASNAVQTTSAFLSGTLNVQGTSNLWVANIANIYTTNIVGFVGSQWVGLIGSPLYYSQQVGIGTASAPPASGPTLYVSGNIYASNAVQTTNVVASGNVSAAQFLGVGGFILAPGNPTVGVTGNVYASNAVQTTNVVASGNVSAAQLLGVGGFILAPGNPTVGVTGNVYVSNALTTTNLFANTLTLSNAVSVIKVTGNIYASNALTTTNLFANTLTLSNAVSVINVTGNIYASNALTTTNLFANTLTLSNAVSVINVTGNIYASNALTTTNLFANTLTLSNSVSFINVTGNVYASNSLQTTNVYASNIADQTGTFGTTGQYLSKGAAGTSWVSLSTNPLSGTVTTSAVTYAASSSTIQTAPGIIITNPTASGGTVVLTCSGDIVAYSDRNIKTDIEPIPDALSKVSRIGGYTFFRTDNGKDRRTGVIAQEVQEVLPEAVYTTDNGTLTVAYGNMVGLLIEAIKELKTSLDTAHTRITELENKFQS